MILDGMSYILNMSLIDLIAYLNIDDLPSMFYCPFLSDFIYAQKKSPGITRGFLKLCNK